MMFIIINFALCQNLSKIHSVGKEIHRVGKEIHRVGPFGLRGNTAFRGVNNWKACVKHIRYIPTALQSYRKAELQRFKAVAKWTCANVCILHNSKIT